MTSFSFKTHLDPKSRVFSCYFTRAKFFGFEYENRHLMMLEKFTLFCLEIFSGHALVYQDFGHGTELFLGLRRAESARTFSCRAPQTKLLPFAAVSKTLIFTLCREFLHFFALIEKIRNALNFKLAGFFCREMRRFHDVFKEYFEPPV